MSPLACNAQVVAEHVWRDPLALERQTMLTAPAAARLHMRQLPRAHPKRPRQRTTSVRLLTTGPYRQRAASCLKP